MTIKERINKILATHDVKLKAEETKLAEATLENGTVIFTEGEFTEGADVFITTEEGENIPLPAGEYVLADGGTLTIDDSGKVLTFVVAAKEELQEVTLTAEMVTDIVTKLLDERFKQELKEEEEDKEIKDLMSAIEKQATELSELKKKAATEGLKRKEPKPKSVAVDLSKLTTEERIKAIQKQYS